MTTLILINGSPGTGKSTLAQLYAKRHPLTLALDLDVLRSMLGGWLDQPTPAGLITRQMAIEVARVQLQAGRDVIVPQYLGRLDFVLELEELSRQTGAVLVEIALVAEAAAVASRFRRRSEDPETPSHIDAARLLEISGGAPMLREMHDRLSDVLAQRPDTIAIESIDGQIEHSYAALLAAIGEHSASRAAEPEAATISNHRPTPMADR